MAFNNQLYAYTYPDIVQSTDAGESWKSILIDSKSTGKKQSLVKFSSNSNLVVADGTLYGIADEEENLRIYRLPTNANVFVPIQGIPAFYKEMLSTELWKSVAEAKLSLPDETRMDPNLVKALRGTVTQAITGGFATSNGTFYVEYQRVLFKWKPGDSEWINTGLIDLAEQSRPHVLEKRVHVGCLRGGYLCGKTGWQVVFNRLMRVPVGKTSHQSFRSALPASKR